MSQESPRWNLFDSMQRSITSKPLPISGEICGKYRDNLSAYRKERLKRTGRSRIKRSEYNNQLPLRTSLKPLRVIATWSNLYGQIFDTSETLNSHGPTVSPSSWLAFIGGLTMKVETSLNPTTVQRCTALSLSLTSTHTQTRSPFGRVRPRIATALLIFPQ